MIPDLSVLWVVLIVFVLTVTLDKLLFKPVGRIMAERAQAIRTARELAEHTASRASAAAAEFESRLRAARTEIYREMDEKRRAALAARAKVLARTRQEAEQAIASATARLHSEAAEARARLERDAEALGSAIVERVLGRTVS